MSEENTNGGCCGCGSGVGLGTILAVCMSWTTNHSIIWALIHGFLSWIYVFYWMLNN